LRSKNEDFRESFEEVNKWKKFEISEAQLAARKK
jgi:hypothetical protein